MHKKTYANDKGNGQLEKLADELAALAGAPVGSQLGAIEAAWGAVSLTRKVVAHTRRRIFIARETCRPGGPMRSLLPLRPSACALHSRCRFTIRSEHRIEFFLGAVLFPPLSLESDVDSWMLIRFETNQTQSRVASSGAFVFPMPILTPWRLLQRAPRLTRCPAPIFWQIF